MAESSINVIKNDIKELEVKIEKFPWAVSPLLIDEFFLMGYTEVFKREKIINPIISEITSKNNYEEYYNLKEFKNLYLPSALSTITSESKINRIDIEHVISYAFAIPPKIFYYIENKGQTIKEPDIPKILFSDINNQTIYNGYVYGFNENEIIELKKGINLHVIIPKFFILISQYHYYFALYKICENLHKLFLRDDNEIPLEVQIYNIVNYLPCPLNSKLELDLFLRNNALNCKTLEEFKNLGKNNNIFLDKLGAYKHSEINFCKIFEICSPGLIVQTLILILSNGKIGLFHENPEILTYVMYFFYQVTFPLAHQEKIFTQSPNSYFYGDDIDFQDNIFGFPCDFDKVSEYHPEKKNYLILEKFYEIKRRIIGMSKAKINTLVNLMKENIKFVSVEDIDECECEPEIKDEKPEEQDYSEEEKKLIEINDFLQSLFKNPDNYLQVHLNSIIFELYQTLTKLSESIKEKKYFSYFIENDSIKKYSLDVREAFFRFIVLFSIDYFKVYMTYQMKKNKPESKEDEKITLSLTEDKIYSGFRNTFYDNILNNMIGVYKEGEPLYMRASKKNFDNLMSLCKADKTNEQIFRGHFIDFLDCIFLDKKNISEEYVSFFEFDKYYNDNMKKNMFYWASEDIIDKRKILKDNEIKYYYKYKNINLSNDLIMKYSSYLGELNEDIKKGIFPKKVNMDNALYSKDIYQLIDNFLISNKLIYLKDLLQYCLLSIVILSIPELKLMTFTEPIYNLFPKMNTQIRKYVELILNISYRFFSKNKEIKTKEELNQYFDIYKKAVEERNLFSNDELTLLRNKISEFIQQKEEGYNLKQKNIISKILSTQEDSLFKLTPEKLSTENYEDVQKEGEINKKISITGELLENKEISEEFIYYPNTLYKTLNDLVYKFYQDLDLDKIREQYYKLIINVMFYIRLMKDKFPDNTLKFLFYCLIQDKEPIVKEKIIKTNEPETPKEEKAESENK